MNYVRTIILVALFQLNTEGVSAQSRFKASLIAGYNFSQIQGDMQDGYKKKGKSLGLAGGFVVLPDLDICTELLYNERGAEASTKSGFADRFYSNISLKYSEMAILAHYFFSPQIAKNCYEQSLKIGFSYGRLLKSQTEVFQNQMVVKSVEQALTQNYNRNDISFVAAWAYHFSPRFNISIRHTNSLSFLYKSPESAVKGDFGNLRPFFLSTHLTYDFITPKNAVVKLKKKKSRVDPLEEL